MPYAQVGDIEIYYEQHGSGPDLLLIMGLGAHSGAWAPQIAAFKAHFRVTVFDNRRAGRSSAPDASYSMVQFATDTAGLLAALKIPKAHILGVSMGGMIAQELALHHPERVGRLILACSRAKAGSLRKTMAPAQAMIVASDLPAASRTLITLPWTFTPRFMADSNKVNALLKLRANDPYAIRPYAYRHQLNAVLAHDTLDRLSRIDAPTLVLVGAEDILTPVWESEEIARSIAAAELKILPNGGHSFCTEYPNDVNAAVLAFLGRA